MGTSRSAKDKTVTVKGKADFELTEEEIEIVVRILRKHRMTLPSYLQSMKREVEIVDGLLEKLS